MGAPGRTRIIKARRDAILKICELEKAHALAVKKRSEEQSLGIDDAKIMDPKPPNPDLRAGAGPYPYDPGAEDHVMAHRSAKKKCDPR